MMGCSTPKENKILESEISYGPYNMLSEKHEYIQKDTSVIAKSTHYYYDDANRLEEKLVTYTVPTNNSHSLLSQWGYSKFYDTLGNVISVEEDVNGDGYTDRTYTDYVQQTSRTNNFYFDEEGVQLNK